MGTLNITGLGKAYRQYRNPGSRLLEWVGAAPRHNLTWILRDINLSVRSGESVGLIGRNGAGKSTLLKLITGVTAPTEGSVAMTGSMAALLELGLGFHPEFTGRHNVYMQGYLQGLGHAQMDALMPSIADFAEIGSYLDRPVRIYSSGMQVRLAFSVATAIRPEILIVDEALSVGDAYFQHKCFDRIRQFRAQGTTLLFVSHDPGAVKTLCDRAVLINDGTIQLDGNPADVLDYYNALIAPNTPDHAIQTGTPEGGGTRSGTGAVHIVEAGLSSHGKSISAINAGQPAAITVQIQVRDPLEDFTLGLLIKDRLGNDIFGTNTHHMGQALGPVVAGSTLHLSFNIPALALGPGHYSVTLAAHASYDHLAGNYDWWERAIVFQVMPALGTHTIGTSHMPITCHLRAHHATAQ
jgi:lipopolysaccharide transport system ATP-binding protein